MKCFHQTVDRCITSSGKGLTNEGICVKDCYKDWLIWQDIWVWEKQKFSQISCSYSDSIPPSTHTMKTAYSLIYCDTLFLVTTKTQFETELLHVSSNLSSHQFWRWMTVQNTYYLKPRSAWYTYIWEYRHKEEISLNPHATQNDLNWGLRISRWQRDRSEDANCFS